MNDEAPDLVDGGGRIYKTDLNAKVPGRTFYVSMVDSGVLTASTHSRKAKDEAVAMMLAHLVKDIRSRVESVDLSHGLVVTVVVDEVQP